MNLPFTSYVGFNELKVICVKEDPISILQVGEHVLLVELNIVLDDVLDICRIQYFLKFT